VRDNALLLQKLFQTAYFRVSLLQDVVGWELGVGWLASFWLVWGGPGLWGLSIPFFLRPQTVPFCVQKTRRYSRAE
jgi:hypothetical protein